MNVRFKANNEVEMSDYIFIHLPTVKSGFLLGVVSVDEKNNCNIESHYFVSEMDLSCKGIDCRKQKQTFFVVDIAKSIFCFNGQTATVKRHLHSKELIFFESNKARNENSIGLLNSIKAFLKSA